MAVIVGTDGNVTASGISANFNTYNCSITTVETDVTKFTDLVRKVEPGLISATFSASGSMNDDDQLFGADAALTAVNFEAATVTLLVKAGTPNCSVSFPALITSFDINQTVSGDAVFTINGTSNGDVTLSWTGS